MHVLAPSYKNKSKPKAWPLVNSTQLHDFIESKLHASTKKTSKDGPCPLFGYQRFLKDYMQYNSPYRGILMYYGLGTGKTRASIAAAEAMSANMDIVVMVPSSLQKNYVNEIFKCGHPAFELNRNWTFKDKSKLDDVERGLTTSDIIKKHKGVWVPSELNNQSGKPWGSLNDKEREQIRLQVEDMLLTRYEFIKYNSYTHRKRQAWVRKLPKTYFENKVVIIDEVHNFISSIVNNSTIMKTFYNRLMRAKNIKIIALSGTPLQNRPIELAYLMNMLRGPMVVHEFEFKKQSRQKTKKTETKASLEEQVSGYLERDPHVEMFKFIPGKRTLQVGLVPFGFIKNEDGLVRRTNDDTNPLEDIKKTLLEKYGMSITNETSREIDLLPTNDDEFESLFGITSDGKIKNAKLLARRLHGMVSHFSSYDPAQYPTVSERNIVKVKMTPEIFYSYEKLRDNERQQERKNRQRKDDDDKRKFSSTYRILSRMACIYTFPQDIDRVYPSDLKRKRLFLEHAVDDEDASVTKEEDEEQKSTEEKDAKTKAKKDYEDAKKTTLNALKSKHLSREALAKHGPKYLEILKRVDDLKKGSVLMYTQFRGLEGIGIMQKILLNEGYSLIDCVKKRDTDSYELKIIGGKSARSSFIVFSDDKEKNRVLTDIYNSDFQNLPPKIIEDLKSMARLRGMRDDEFENRKNIYGELIKIMLITKSGSEGISLKNVRQVHILEPFWNDVRIEQVIGRAVRAGSHLALPKQERNVDVFMYVMVFGTKEQRNADGGVTTDQHILSIAERKKTVIEAIENVMRASAIDCDLNKGSQCMKPPEGFGPFTYNIQEAILDEKDETLVKRVTESKVQRIFKVIGSKTRKLMYFPDKKGVIDGNKAVLYEYPPSNSKLTRVGVIEVDPETFLPRSKKIQFDED